MPINVSTKTSLHINGDPVSYDNFKIKDIKNTMGLKYYDKANGEICEFTNFDLSCRKRDVWDIIVNEEYINEYPFKIIDKDNNIVDFEELLENKTLGNDIYNKYRCINSLNNFFEITNDLLMLAGEENIIVNINSMNLNKNDEVDIEYEVFDIDTNEIKLTQTVSVSNDKVFEHIEIEQDILDNVLKSLKNVFMEKGILLNNVFYHREPTLEFLEANEYIKRDDLYSTFSDYRAINSGIFDRKYFDNRVSDFKENALAFYNGRMDYNNKYYKSLCEEFKDKFSEEEIREVYFDSLDSILSTKDPFEEVKDLLVDNELSDKLMVITRKGKDNFIVPKISSYIEDQYSGYCFYLEKIATSNDIENCLNILDSVKNSIYEEAYSNAEEHLNDLLENENKQNNKNKVLKKI